MNRGNVYYNNGDRIGFVFPFLLGGLAGGAAVGLSRPRPVYVNQPYNYGYYPGPYYYNSYSYYRPYPYYY